MYIRQYNSVSTNVIIHYGTTNYTTVDQSKIIPQIASSEIIYKIVVKTI